MTSKASNIHDVAGPLLVSACLLGDSCRHDGASAPCDSVVELASRCDVVPICPEQLGGLPTPRAPSEIQPNGRVVDCNGRDNTAAFELGARKAVAIARERGCRVAVLKSNSPSCGVHFVYDGSFSGTLVPGWGRAAAALAQAGLQVIDEMEL